MCGRVCVCVGVYESVCLCVCVSGGRRFLFEGGISFPSFSVAVGSLMAGRISVSANLVSGLRALGLAHLLQSHAFVFVCKAGSEPHISIDKINVF